MGEELKLSKYKIFLIILKFIPLILAILEFLHSVLVLFGYNSILIRYLGGISLIPILFIYIAADVFQFCAYHKMFIYYIVIIEFISFLDNIFQFDVSVLFMLSIIVIITILFLMLILYNYVTNNKKITT